MKENRRGNEKPNIYNFLFRWNSIAFVRNQLFKYEVPQTRLIFSRTKCLVDCLGSVFILLFFYFYYFGWPDYLFAFAPSPISIPTIIFHTRLINFLVLCVLFSLHKLERNMYICPFLFFVFCIMSNEHSFSIRLQFKQHFPIIQLIYDVQRKHLIVVVFWKNFHFWSPFAIHNFVLLSKIDFPFSIDFFRSWFKVRINYEC